MFAWIFRRLLQSFGSTGVIPTPGGQVCGTVAIFPRVNGTVGVRPRVNGTVKIAEC